MIGKDKEFEELKINGNQEKKIVEQKLMDIESSVHSELLRKDSEIEKLRREVNDENGKLKQQRYECRILS